jgi:hypothetical protein
MQVRKIRCDKDKDVLKRVARTKVERDDVDMAGVFHCPRVWHGFFTRTPSSTTLPGLCEMSSGACSEGPGGDQKAACDDEGGA